MGVMSAPYLSPSTLYQFPLIGTYQRDAARAARRQSPPIPVPDELGSSGTGITPGNRPFGDAAQPRETSPGLGPARHRAGTGTEPAAGHR